MLIPRRRFLHLAGAGLALPALSRAAHGQAYPSRPITMIVPYPAGGPTDTVGRTVAEWMRRELGQPIVLENITGAAGSIGLGRLARAPADGYTIEVGNWSAHVVNGAIYNLPYDLKNDFEPIALLARAPQVVLSSKAVPAHDLKSLIAWMKANPGKATIGTAGVGSPPHIAAVLFLKLTGTQAQLVPYRGAAPAVQDLVMGQIDMTLTDPTSAVPQVRAGTIKGYAVSARERLAAAPDIPTADEAGLPGFYVSTWNAMFAPKGTPKPIIAKLNAAAVAALADPAVRSRFTALGQEIPPRDEQSPEALDALVKADIEKWWPIIKAANIKPE
jgi:tripartite-type tricarboxylate transporter receptor subunit TctC